MGKFNDKLNDLDYYFITSSSDNPLCSMDPVETVRMALEGGSRIIQLREKLMPYDELLESARKIREITRDHDALFIINDDIQLCMDSDADGVHVGQSDSSLAVARKILGPDRIIGVSNSNVEQAMESADNGADYVSLSVFSTLTKVGGNKPCGLGSLKKLRKAMYSGECRKVPIVAIGGLNENNYGEAVSAGADMVCALSDVLKSSDIRSKVRSFVEGIRKIKRIKDM